MHISDEVVGAAMLIAPALAAFQQPSLVKPVLGFMTCSQGFWARRPQTLGPTLARRGSADVAVGCHHLGGIATSFAAEAELTGPHSTLPLSWGCLGAVLRC